MYLTKKLIQLSIKSLAASIDIRALLHLIRELVPSYNINERMNIADNMPIPRREAARQIIADLAEGNLFLELISLLIQIQDDGYRGRQYNFVGLENILWEIKDQGFVYDWEYEMFVEDTSVRRTRNWGTLRDQQEYVFALLRIDIVGYSNLVRNSPAHAVKADYDHLTAVVESVIKKRKGRIWCQDGDGIIVAFHFSNKYLLSVICAIEILHEMMLYNRLEAQLEKPMQLRIVVHSGNMEYAADPEEIKRRDLVKRIMEIEKKDTKANTITVTNIVSGMLDPLIVKYLNPLKSHGSMHYYYEMIWE